MLEMTGRVELHQGVPLLHQDCVGVDGLVVEPSAVVHALELLPSDLELAKVDEHFGVLCVWAAKDDVPRGAIVISHRPV